MSGTGTILKGVRKMQEWKMQDRKMTDQIAGTGKCIGLENDGPNKPNLSQYVHWVVPAYKNHRFTVPVEMMKFK